MKLRSGNKQRKFTETFNLEDMGDCTIYEQLQNDPDIEITKEITNFDKAGNTKVAVWYTSKSGRDVKYGEDRKDFSPPLS